MNKPYVCLNCKRQHKNNEVKSWVDDVKIGVKDWAYFLCKYCNYISMYRIKFESRRIETASGEIWP